jgi:hypothetical protein
MAWDLEDFCDVYYDDANFMDSQSVLSLCIRFQLNSINTGVNQYLVSHKGATNQFSIRKHSDDNKWRWSVTSGGTAVTCDDSSATPAIDTTYCLCGMWKKNDASGMEIWRDGVSRNTASTTTQTSDYDSGGSVDLYVGARKFNDSYGKCDVEEVWLWAGHELTLAQVQALNDGCHWLDIAGLPKPSAWWEFNERMLTRVPDRSGNGRSIESATIDSTHPPSAGGIILPRSPRCIIAPASNHRVSVSGPAEPNPWTFWEDVLHPVAASTVTGLTNTTTYEFKVNALDQTANISADSAIVEATPSEPTPVTSDYRIPWKRPKRKSKYRSTQQ